MVAAERAAESVSPSERACGRYRAPRQDDERIGESLVVALAVVVLAVLRIDTQGKQLLVPKNSEGFEEVLNWLSANRELKRIAVE